MGTRERRVNVLHQELFHVIFNFWMPHNKRTQSGDHVQSAVLLRGLWVRSQDIVDETKDRHERCLGPAPDELEKERGSSCQWRVEIRIIVCHVGFSVTTTIKIQSETNQQLAEQNQWDLYPTILALRE
jgi:hypothetical protein